MSTPRDRVLAVLAGQQPDKIPFVIWDNKIPDEATLRVLLDHDACIIVKSAAYSVALEGIDISREPFTGDDGAPRVRLTYRTPAGPLTVIQRPMPSTVWTETHPFTGPADYDALECLIAARRYTATPDRLRQDDARYPGQSIARPGTLHSPIHDVLNDLLGVEAFCLEWYDNRERIARLCALLHDDLIAQVQLLAAGPAPCGIVDGNTQFDILGLDRYEQYSMPIIAEACAILHAAGKYAGAHLDGNTARAAQLVAKTPLDFIESFSPPPDCDFPLSAARQAWPRKGLIVNFPSSVHLGGATAVRQRLQELLREAGDGRGVAIGVLEDIPTNDHLRLLAAETQAWKL